MPSQSIQSFSDYLVAHNATLTDQSTFSTNYTAWLDNVVLGNASVQTWLQGQLSAAQLVQFQAGQWHIDLEQNSTTAAPIIDFNDGTTFGLNALFAADLNDGKEHFSWTQAHATQTRYYVDDAVVPQTTPYFTFDFHSPDHKVADSVDTNDYEDHTGDTAFNGAAGDPGSNGSDATLSGTSTIGNQTLTAGSGTTGDNGGSGEDGYNITNTAPYAGIKIISEGASANSILGGNGGDGGDGGNGGDATVTATGIHSSANTNILTARDGGNGGDGGSGGHAIINGDLSTVIIQGSQDLSILGGTIGAGGAGGAGGDATVTAGNNANSNTLTPGDGGNGGDGSTAGDGGAGGHATLTAGPGGQTNGNTLHNSSSGQDGALSPIVAAFSNTVNVDASAFTGHLTISGSDFDDTMIFGVGGTTVYATTGNDTYAFNNAAPDTIVYTAANQSNGTSSTNTINNFDVALDRIDISAIAQAGFTFNAPDANTLDIHLNSGADMVIKVTGVAQSITLTDFIA